MNICHHWGTCAPNKKNCVAFAKKEETMLPQKRMVVTLCEDQEELALAEKARTVLGYSLLEAETTKPLLRKLLSLDITPLDTAEVEKYKMQKSEGSPGRWVYAALDEATHQRKRGIYRGETIPIYKERIPEFVLHKAIQIREAFPEVNLYVHHDHYEEIVDPFLVADLGEESYYIEVWDEPKFEGRIR